MEISENHVIEGQLMHFSVSAKITCTKRDCYIDKGTENVKLTLLLKSKTNPNLMNTVAHVDKTWGDSTGQTLTPGLGLKFMHIGHHHEVSFTGSYQVNIEQSINLLYMLYYQ